VTLKWHGELLGRPCRSGKLACQNPFCIFERPQKQHAKNMHCQYAFLGNTHFQNAFVQYAFLTYIFLIFIMGAMMQRLSETKNCQRTSHKHHKAWIEMM
jgi:hypothetical protein